MDQRVCLNLAKKDQLCTTAFMNRKKIEGFTQNGYYGNQPQPFEVGSVGVNTKKHCSFTKQDLTVKQASVLLCAIKFWQLTLVFSSFYRLFLEITSFFTTPIRQIIPCGVAGIKDFKMLQFFGLLHHDSISL